MFSFYNMSNINKECQESEYDTETDSVSEIEYSNHYAIKNEIPCELDNVFLKDVLYSNVEKKVKKLNYEHFLNKKIKTELLNEFEIVIDFLKNPKYWTVINDSYINFKHVFKSNKFYEEYNLFYKEFENVIIQGVTSVMLYDNNVSIDKFIIIFNNYFLEIRITLDQNCNNYYNTLNNSIIENDE